MSNSNQSDSKKLIHKKSPALRWAIPASILAGLGLILSFVFLPFGLLFFTIALVVTGVNVLRKEEPKDALTDTIGDEPSTN